MCKSIAFFNMQIYTIDITRDFQILMLDSTSRILGLCATECCDKDSLPKLTIQNVTPRTSNGRATQTIISRCLYSVLTCYEGSQKQLEAIAPPNFSDRIQSQPTPGSLNSSQMNFLGTFRYRCWRKAVSNWSVFLETFPNETPVVSSSTGEASVQGFAEGSLLRTIT